MDNNENHNAPSPETITGEMVEAGARAIAADLDSPGCSQFEKCGTLIGGCACRNDARLAITAALALPRKDGPDWQAMYEELKSTHIEKVEAIRAEYMAMTYSTIAANSRKDGAVCAPQLETRPVAYRIPMAHGGYELTLDEEYAQQIADDQGRGYAGLYIRQAMNAGETPGPSTLAANNESEDQRTIQTGDELTNDMLNASRCGEPTPETSAEAALAYAIWDSENTIRMKAECIQEHLARASSVIHWLRVHEHKIVSCTAPDTIPVSSGLDIASYNAAIDDAVDIAKSMYNERNSIAIAIEGLRKPAPASPAPSLHGII